MSVPQNILIIRLSAIGDVVFASPLIAALKRTYPNARISWLVEPAAAALLKANPMLDEIIIWDKSALKGLWRERQLITLWKNIRSFRQQLKQYQFDLVLDLQGLQKSAFWAYATGAPKRIGLGSKEGSQHLMTETISRQTNNKRIGSEYLKLAEYLKLDCADFAMDIALTDNDELFGQQQLARGEYIVICPFTTRAQKHWIEAYWLALIAKLQTQFPYQILMLGGPADLEAATAFTSQAPKLQSLVGKCSLTETAAIIKHAKALIGVDTGLTHMGIAFSRPTVAIFGSTRPYFDTTKANAQVLYHKFSCSPCRRRPSCNGTYDCMRAITEDEVLLTLEKVINL